MCGRGLVYDSPDQMRRATRRRLFLMHLKLDGAEEGTRTPTPLRVRGPEPRASANSATSARDTNPALSARSAASLSLAKAGYCVKSRGPAHRLRNALLRRIQNRRSGHFGKVNLSSAFQRFKL